MRLDVYLTKEKNVESRNKASALIASGFVFVNGKIAVKPSVTVTENDCVQIISNEKQYVSRSAKKLLTAIEKFGLEFNDKIAVDLGASTGGFTQVMLDHGASKVYAVDIGTNQLHPLLKNDCRVINKEHVNARFVSAATFDDDIDIITCDLSFISLKLILNSVYCSLADGGEFVCLIKPQFEAGKSNLNKNGVVKDLTVHQKVICQIALLANDLGFSVKGLTFSGLEGEAGNKEYLIYLVKDGKSISIDIETIKKVVLGEL